MKIYQGVGLRFDTGRVIARFSCGAASAVATKLAIEEYGEAVEIYYNDTGSEHPDNKRFILDCEQWYGRKINVIKSGKYKNIYEVFEARQFLVSFQGTAPCTGELKISPGLRILQLGDLEVFGYTADEDKRLQQFLKDHPDRRIGCPLIDAGLTKSECFDELAKEGITLPAMYRLGFRNNNCIGCVKARDSIDYWKRVRKHFPEQFQRTVELERKFGFAINRRSVNKKKIPIFLDEIEPGDPIGADLSISCGLFCGTDKEGDRV